MGAVDNITVFVYHLSPCLSHFIALALPSLTLCSLRLYCWLDCFKILDLSGELTDAQAICVLNPQRLSVSVSQPMCPQAMCLLVVELLSLSVR